MIFLTGPKHFRRRKQTSQERRRLKNKKHIDSVCAPTISMMVLVFFNSFFSVAPWRTGAVFISTMPHLSTPSEGLHNERELNEGQEGKRFVMQHI